MKNEEKSDVMMIYMKKARANMNIGANRRQQCGVPLSVLYKTFTDENSHEDFIYDLGQSLEVSRNIILTAECDHYIGGLGCPCPRSPIQLLLDDIPMEFEFNTDTIKVDHDNNLLSSVHGVSDYLFYTKMKFYSVKIGLPNVAIEAIERRKGSHLCDARKEMFNQNCTDLIS